MDSKESKSVKKPSLSTHVGECFFGFADSAKEEQFRMLKAKERIPLLMMISVMGGASAMFRAWQFRADYMSNPLGSFLMDSVGPQSLSISLFSRMFKGFWRWLEPTIVVCSFVRVSSLLSWLLCDPTATLSIVQWWSGPLHTMVTFFCFSFFLAAANFVSNVRFKYGFLSALLWMAVAPVIAHYSPTELQAWPLFLSMGSMASLRLHGECKARSEFLSLFYPSSESQLATVAAAPSEDDPNPYDEMSDTEFQELIKMVKCSVGETLAFCEAAALPMYETVYLRIPGADPDDLAPDAKLKLKEQFEAAYPGYTVDDITFQRGSLLVGMRVSPPTDAKTPVTRKTTVRKVKGIECSSWLAWLGLPADLDMSVKVNIPTDRRTNLLDRFPLAVTVPVSEEGVHTVYFPLYCTELPQGVAIKASLGEHVLECNVVGADVPPGSPPAAQGLSVQVKLPIKTLCVSCCWLVTVNVQDLSDHIIVGDRTVVLLDKALAVMEPELCPMRLVRPQDMPHVLKTPGVEQPCGPEIVCVLCLWMQSLCAVQQLADGVQVESQNVGQEISEQLAAIWRSGNLLLTFLVGNGCKESAKQVIELLLNSSALSPLVHGSSGVQPTGTQPTGTQPTGTQPTGTQPTGTQPTGTQPTGTQPTGTQPTGTQPTGAHTESLNDCPSFLDFMSGVHNSVGSTVMHIAVMSGNCAMVDEVMRWSHAYNLPCQWETKDSHGMTPLHLAQLVNDGKMATFLLRKGDPLLAQAWQAGGERRGSGRRGGSPEQFSHQMAKIRTPAGSSLHPQGSSSRTSLRSLPSPRQPRSTGVAIPQLVSASTPAILPTQTATSAGPRRRGVTQDMPLPHPQPCTGHPPPLTASNSASSSRTTSVPPGRHRGAGGPNPTALVKLLRSGSARVNRFIASRIKQIPEVSGLIVNGIKRIPAVPVQIVEQIPELFHVIVWGRLLLLAFFCVACMWYTAMPYLLVISIVCDQVFMRMRYPIKGVHLKSC